MIQNDREETTKMRVNLTCFSWFDPQNKSAFSASWEEKRDRERESYKIRKLDSQVQGISVGWDTEPGSEKEGLPTF